MAGDHRLLREGFREPGVRMGAGAGHLEQRVGERHPVRLVQATTFPGQAFGVHCLVGPNHHPARRAGAGDQLLCEADIAEDDRQVTTDSFDGRDRMQLSAGKSRDP